MSAGRCPECDAPLATLADHSAWREAGEPDDYRPDLCWARPDLVAVVHSGEFTLQCMREPVDWRARAQAAEARLERVRGVAYAGADSAAKTQTGRERVGLAQAIGALDRIVLIDDEAKP